MKITVRTGSTVSISTVTIMLLTLPFSDFNIVVDQSRFISHIVTNSHKNSL